MQSIITVELDAYIMDSSLPIFHDPPLSTYVVVVNQTDVEYSLGPISPDYDDIDV